MNRGRISCFLDCIALYTIYIYGCLVRGFSRQNSVLGGAKRLRLYIVINTREDTWTVWLHQSVSLEFCYGRITERAMVGFVSINLCNKIFTLFICQHLSLVK